MDHIEILTQDISDQYLLRFFESRISSFKPDRDVFEGIIKDENLFDTPVKIGYTQLQDGNELLVFTCKSYRALTARSSKKQQFEIARKVLKEDFKDGAIFVFYDEYKNFRFSFIRRFYGEDKKYSNWKRFTYYVSPGETNKTFKQRLNQCSFKSLDAIQEAFSVEKLTKEFYSDLFNWYQWVLSKEVGVTFPENLKDQNVHLEEQIIRLITRLLFVWFIRQKHLVPGYFFEVEELKKILKSFDPGSKKEGNYYNAVLQNLFFATLNKPIEDRGFAKKKDNRDLKTLYRYSEMFAIPEKKVMEIFKPIPFLNGGLFECLDKEESTDGLAVHFDGFSRNAEKFKNGHFKHRAFIPNRVFFGDGGQNEGLIPLLNRYNFTVEENVPNEVQVALDPELLGNVFENLLGTFNPETRETARKESGSFYTPREIVSFMVKESLIESLKNELPRLEEKIIRSLFDNDYLPAELENDHELCCHISEKLRAIKVLDPACGSGAFPMGILNQMVEVLEKLDVNNRETHYNLKLHLIEECIYGVDIQTIAAQISKLRFFISLIVEQDQPDLTKPQDNYGVITLPNLETKFVSANTLISPSRQNTDPLDLSDPELKKRKAELLDIRRKHFYANSTYKKMKLRREDEALRKEIEAYLIARDTKTDEEKIKIYEAQIEKLQEERKKYEEPDWTKGEATMQQGTLFGNEAKQVSLFKKDKNTEKRIETDNIINGIKKAIWQEKRKIKRTGLEEEVTNILKWDPYTQNQKSDWFDPEWMFGIKKFNIVLGNPPYGAKILKKEKEVIKQVFNNNTSETSILFIERGLGLCCSKGVLFYIVPKAFAYASNYKGIRNYIERELIILVDCGKAFEVVKLEANIIGLIKDIEHASYKSLQFTLYRDFQFIGNIDKKLKKIFDFYPNGITDAEIILGLKLLENSFNLNEISVNSRGEMLQGFLEDEGRYKIIGGKEIQRYGIVGHKGFIKDGNLLTEKSRVKKNSVLVQNIIAHIIQPYPQIKIISCIPNQHVFILDTINQIQILNNNYTREIIWALLNSKLINWYAYLFVFAKAIRTMHFDNTTTRKIIIPKTIIYSESIKEVVDLILSKRKNNQDTTYEEQQIDLMVYRMYNLTYDEVLIVDPEFGMSRKEYETGKG